jgi:hypothetical protein
MRGSPTLIRRDFLRMLAVAPLAASGFAGDAQLSAAIGLVDKLASFWPVYDRAAAGDRIDALRRGYFEPEARLYKSAGIVIKRERIDAWLPDFDKIANDVRRLHRRFAAAYATHEGHFEKAFPDFDRTTAPVYLMLSLGDFDAHLQPSKGRLPLFIGLDGIVQYHGADADLAVLLDHESYHLYQGQVNPQMSLDERPPLFFSLWLEGTATWVSQYLNPKASPLDILLSDKPLAAATPDAIRRAAAALLEKMDSEKDKDADRFFGAGYEGSEPARIGYLLGLKVAQQAAARYSPAGLARLDAGAVRDICETGLRAIARM